MLAKKIPIQNCIHKTKPEKQPGRKFQHAMLQFLQHQPAEEKGEQSPLSLHQILIAYQVKDNIS